MKHLILATKLAVQELFVEDWNQLVHVRVLTARELDQFKDGIGMSMDNASARLAVLSLCDKEGNRLFEDVDAVELGKTSARALKQVVDAILELNRMDGNEQKKS
jgi:hypothetical protein